MIFLRSVVVSAARAFGYSAAGKRSTYQKPLSVERDPDARQAQRNRLAECAQVRATAAMVLQHGLKETMQNQYLVPRHAAPTQARKRSAQCLLVLWHLLISSGLQTC